MKTAQEVGANVRAEMARAGITQTRLGESLGLPQSAVSKRLRGARAFTVDELIRTAQVLDVDVTVLMPAQAERAAS